MSQQQENIDYAVAEGMALCRGVVQQYLAYLQGMDPLALFPDGIQSSAELGFSNATGTHHLKLALVSDSWYQFNSSRCAGAALRTGMEKIMHNLKLVTQYILEHEMSELRETLPRPELFAGSRMVTTPLTSAFLYNEACGRELHDQFAKRIAFVWV